MTAPAIRRGSSRPRFIRIALGALVFAHVPGRAAAEVGAVVSAYTDLRYRGATLSGGRPVGILDLSYDARSGLYGALSATVVATRHDGLEPLGLTVNGGYARRVGGQLSADVGVFHSRYSRQSRLPPGRSYTEAYAGLSGKIAGVRLSLSPDYVGNSGWTLHGGINGHLEVSKSLFVDGELGALIPLGGYTHAGGSGGVWDARLGLAQRVGSLSLHAAVTARGARADIYEGRSHRRVAVILGFSSAL